MRIHSVSKEKHDNKSFDRFLSITGLEEEEEEEDDDDAFTWPQFIVTLIKSRNAFSLWRYKT